MVWNVPDAILVVMEGDGIEGWSVVVERSSLTAGNRSSPNGALAARR